MADLVTRLRLDNKEFDDNLKRSQKSLKSFESIGKGAKASLSSLLGVIKGYAGPLTAAVSAGAAFNKIMRGSQTTSDALDRVMRACSTSVDAFFTSLSTGDFSVFDNGINGIIIKAKEAAAALDQLGNTLISYDYFSGKNNALFHKHLANSRDKSLSDEDRKSALDAAKKVFNEQEEYTNTLVNTTIDAVKKVATETAGILNADDITYEDVEDILRLDVSATRDEEKKELTDKYNELLQIRDDFLKKFTTEITTVDILSGQIVKKTVPDKAKVNKALKPLLEDYKKAILYNEILVKKTGDGSDNDSWLKNLSAYMAKAESGKMALSSMQNQLVRINNSLNVNTKPKKTKAEEIIPEGSLKELEKKIADLKSQISLTVDEKSRTKLYKELEELEEKERVIKFKYEHTDSKGSEFIKPTKRDSFASMAKKPDMLPKIPKLNSKDNKVFKANTDSANDYAAALTNCANAVATFNTQKLEDTGEGWTQWSTNLLAAAASTIIGLQSLTMAKGVNSAFDLPFPANLAAAAMVLSTVISLFASIPTFANGGIFESNLTTGDKNIARLNGGEMILNKGQQYNLFKLLDNGGSLNSNSEIQFKLRGSDIYGSLTNYNKKMSKIR